MAMAGELDIMAVSALLAASAATPEGVRTTTRGDEDVSSRPTCPVLEAPDDPPRTWSSGIPALIVGAGIGPCQSPE
jgi:hypothetical protein